jgi:hypothetical protein
MISTINKLPLGRNAHYVRSLMPKTRKPTDLRIQLFHYRNAKRQKQISRPTRLGSVYAMGSSYRHMS